MIEADRLITAAPGPRDREEVQDRAIRPVSLAEYIGQPVSGPFKHDLYRY